MAVPHRGHTRREFLTAVGAGSAGMLALPVGRARAERPGSAGPFTGTRATRLAMHVHASWSEGLASWETQFRNAAATGIDVLYLTDHDNRALAYAYLPSLLQAVWVTSPTGAASERRMTAANGSVHLVVESATTGPASAAMAIEPVHQAKTHLRTSISGFSLKHTFGAVTLTGGALYEVRLDLSHHPAGPGRPEGTYRLDYRFGTPSRARFTEQGGLVGVVAAPKPASGTVVTLTPQADVAALWPSMAAIDNACYGLTVSVVSQRRGSRADVTVRSCTFSRTRNTPAAVIADQAALVSRYTAAYPAVRGRPTCEIGRTPTHLNPFGVPQSFPSYAVDTPTDHDAFYLGVVSHIHSAGGIVSLNHPLGYDSLPLLSPAEQVRIRRSAYAWLAQRHLYGCDILEVGYTARGHCDTSRHLALWDTFSRNGLFLTGNGANDDHDGQPWSSLVNGFFTGVWSAGAAEPDVVSALRAGRAYTAHAGRWPAGWIDLLLDGGVPMGSVVVDGGSTHRLSISAAPLPSGARVEVVRGSVDYSGAIDPATVVDRVLTAASFKAGVCSISISTPSSSFWRVQVKDGVGNVIAVSNPLWILHRPPPSGIPAPRRV